MLCLLRRRAIASKFDFFVIHETHVQSACRRHRQYVTTAIHVEMFCKLQSFWACIKICIRIDFHWDTFCKIVVLKVEKAQNLPRIDEPCVALATVSKEWLEQNPWFYLYLINICQACLTWNIINIAAMANNLWNLSAYFWNTPRILAHYIL